MEEDPPLVVDPADVTFMAQQKVDPTQQPVKTGDLTTLSSRIDSVSLGTTTWLSDVQRRGLNAINAYIAASWGGLFGQIPGPYMGAPTVSTPTHEWIANPLYYTLTDNKVTEWKDRNNPTTQMITSTSYTVAPPTDTYPEGVRKWTTDPLLTNTFHLAKQTLFVVYTWPVSPPDTLVMIGTRGAGSPAPNHMWPRKDTVKGPLWIMYSGASGTEMKMPLLDTALNKPHITGLSWDFTLNPPQFTVLQNGTLIQNDSNSRLIALHVQAMAGLDGISIQPVTGQKPVYNSVTATDGSAAANNLSIFSRVGGAAGTSADAILHYIGSWEKRYMSVEEMYACYHRLAERYTHRVQSLGNPNVGINDEFDDVVMPGAEEDMDTSAP